LYKETRKTTLSKEDFSSMLVMLPSVLVANADNDFDELEKQNLAASCFGLEADPWITCETYSELCYLATADNHELLNNVLACIKTEVSDNAETKLIIENLMIEMAKSSDGISAEESAKINELREILSL
jgi:tellurite resistance protein